MEYDQVGATGVHFDEQADGDGVELLCGAGTREHCSLVTLPHSWTQDFGSPTESVGELTA